MHSSPDIERSMVNLEGSKGLRLDLRGATMNLRGAKGESNTFTSCESHL